MRDKEFLSLRKIFHNVEIKLSTVGGLERNQLVLVTTQDEIILRYTSESADVILKKIDFFAKNKKIIQGVALDPSAAWLLVLCIDNTIHIVPCLSICDKSISFKYTFSPHEITSYVVPFIGPHECPNAQKCPNHTFDITFTSDMTLVKRHHQKRHHQFEVKKNRFSATKINELCSSSAYNHIYCDQKPQESLSASSSFQKEVGSDAFIEKVPSASSTPCESQFSGAEMMGSSTFSSGSTTLSCPIPTAITWWRTTHADQVQNRAIIGYTDGCIVVVELTNNCPYIGNTVIERGVIEKLAICKDSCCDTIYLLITTSSREQFKLLLEQKSTGYIAFSSDVRNMEHSRSFIRTSENEWEVVAQETEVIGENETEPQTSTTTTTTTTDDLSKLFPAAKARLISLRDLGAKKIENFKMKLSESRNKTREKEKVDDSSRFNESSTCIPELLTTPSGPFFCIQNVQDTNVMGAIHSYSATLSIHNIEIMMIPSSLYKLPSSNASEVLLTETVLYVHEPSTVQPLPNSMSTSAVVATATVEPLTASQQDVQTNENPVTNSSHDDDNFDANKIINDINNSSELCEENVINILSCNLSSTKIGEDGEFNERALLGSFKFPHDEKILNIYPMTSIERENNVDVNAESLNSHEVEMKSTYSKYLNYNSKMKKKSSKFDDVYDCKVLKTEFPKVIFEKCLIVTSKGVYCVELKEKPHIIFLNLASTSSWALCDDFCKTFNLNMTECVEFSGDILLRKKKIEQALLTYNIARIPPIKTALKLAMFNETLALRQISSMALKISFILESKHPMSHLIYELLKDVNERHERSDVIIKLLRDKDSTKPIISEKIISDFVYNSADNYEVQMSNSAQFHLSNLLFLTLCERCVKDKNMMPLWNFIVMNTKYHTSLSSIILSQSGLYSSAILLALHRGSCLDVFSCLVSMADHVFDISNEMLVYMYNLSDSIFMETIIYLQNFGFDYFEAIRKNLDKLNETVLERLVVQLNPFDPIYRPILFKVKNQNIIREMENKFIEFCQVLIETYVLVLIKMQRLQSHKDNFLNSINVFRITSEERQNYVKLMNFTPISAGFSHSACVIENSVYLWGSNGINCALNRNVLQSDASENDVLPTRLDFFKDINLDVFSVHCGRSHTLFLTNNGLYSMGCNKLGQLGIDVPLSIALQPMYIKALDNKIITQISSGQHHNAVVADDQLYTWGWNVYGQCGHDVVKNILQPKAVKFFSEMKIKQVICGQAHTIVLTHERCIYAFGSNHYGSLGVGYEGDFDENKNNSISCIPQRIRIDEDVRLIHTKYFVNFAVTDSNKLYTWGLSPPELRIINQSKKRSKANQKLRESLVAAEIVVEKPEEEISTECADKEKVLATTSSDEKNNKDEKEEIAPQQLAVNLPEIKIDECDAAPCNSDVKREKSVSGKDIKVKDSPLSSTADVQLDESNAVVQEYTEHLLPSLVDTSEIDDDIIYISSGIYHYALITTSSTLFMYGKNIERQLGRENVKPDLMRPTRHAALYDVSTKYVECGADYTLVITTNNELKAFGNNGCGQCGVEIADKQAGMGKLIRLKSSKRVFRIPESSMYLHNPVTVRIPANTPTAYVNFSSNQPICYLKNLPKFKRNCIVESALGNSIRKTFFIDENIMDSNRNPSSFSSISSVASTASESSTKSSEGTNEGDDHYTRSNEYIHYCLFLFQGLYDSTRFYDKSLSHIVGTEYKIRTLMLNYNYIEAFKLALESDGKASSAMSIKIFEYFTTDPNIIPMHTEDIKYFIYDVFLHFIKHEMNIEELEKYLLFNLDYYFLQLAFILYFCGNNNNNNNNVQQNGMEKQLFDKFKHLYSNYENFAYFDSNEIEVIFKSVSATFHCKICQNLLKYSENFN